MYIFVFLEIFFMVVTKQGLCSLIYCLLSSFELEEAK